VANEIPNAVALMRDPDFRDWVCAASCYQAAQVLASGTAASKAMATEVLLNPRGHILERLVNVLATQTAIASVGSTVGTAAGTITQTLLLTQTATVWAPLTAVLYPAA
jgi:DNA-binding beta-propeller fold protein YncE